MIEDYDEMEASFLEQYHVRLWSEELPSEVFLRLLASVKPETPLGNLITIRREDDKETLKSFNKDQLRIRREWREKHGAALAEKEYLRQSKNVKQMFCSMMVKPVE